MKNKKFWVALVAGLMAFAMIFSLILSLIPHASAASSSEIQDQIDNMKAQQEAIQAQYDSLEQQRSENLSVFLALVDEISTPEQQKALLNSEIDLINEQIAAYAVLIADKQAELDEAQALLDELNEKYKDRIRAMEEDGTLSYWDVLFQASSFADLLDRLSIVEEIAAADQRRLDELSAAAEVVAQAQALLQQALEALQQTRQELDDKQAQVEEKTAEVKAIMAELLARGDEFDALFDAGELELAQLEEDIAQAELDLDEAERQEYLEYIATLTVATTAPPTTAPTTAATTEATTAATTEATSDTDEETEETTTTTTPTTNSAGGVGGTECVDDDGIVWLVPCDYIKVSSAFGYRIHPVYGDWRFHAGGDLAAYCPTEILATRAGVVVTSTYSSTAGYYVVIDHLDGYKSTYMHMCKFPDVQVGDVVAAGQVIGCVGSTGTSTGDHLHFGISYNGTAVNPMDYIG